MVITVGRDLTGQGNKVIHNRRFNRTGTSCCQDRYLLATDSSSEYEVIVGETWFDFISSTCLIAAFQPSECAQRGTEPSGSHTL